MDLALIQQEIKENLKSKIDYSREVSEDELWEKIDEEITNQSKKTFLSINTREQLRRQIFFGIRKLDVLQELIDDPLVTEIMVNGKSSIFVERDGELNPYPHTFESDEKLDDVVQQIVGDCNRVVNEASPIVDARLKNGSRVNIVLSPIALNGPIITIRRFPDEPITMNSLIQYGSITQEIITFLTTLVRARYNIFISGGTGSGKTTFLNALSAYIPKDERVITIEDNAELQIQDLPNLVRLETRNANVEGCQEITIRDLIKSSLRMRPDRIIVGEVRGGEAIDMMQCLNTGHDGSMSTGHANSSKDMMSRLETMILMGMELPLTAIRQQIASGLDIVVHLGRLRDKTRKLLEVSEVMGFENGEIKLAPIYQFKEIGETENGKVSGVWEKKNELSHRQKLLAAGLCL